MATHYSLGYEIAKVHKMLRAHVQDLLAPYEITVQQFEVLRALRAESGITAAQLVERILSDSSTIMSILKRLEAKSVVLRVPAEKDRRTKLIYFTEKGRKLTETLIVLADCHNQRVLNCCSAEELQIFEHVLSRLYDSFQKKE